MRLPSLAQTSLLSLSLIRAGIVFAVLAVLSVTMPPANAQQAPGAQPSQAAANHAARLGNVCIGHWSSSWCLTAISESTLVLTANYAATLQKADKDGALDILKEHCAAATAAANGDYPAEAMTSAYADCANHIYEVSDSTGIDPDLSHYQLLIGSIWCLTEDRRCQSIERQLQRY